MSMAAAGASSSASSSPPLVGVLNEAGLKTSSASVIGQNDLLIVGPGVLGRIVAEKWRKEYPDSQIFGHTMTTDHHDELIKVGVMPSLKGSKATDKFPYVIFCAPPTQTPDYPGDVRLATTKWSGEGSFLFTSSSAVYDCSNNGFCDERKYSLLKYCYRINYLYKEDRGAHVYWLDKGTVDARPDHVLNLIHYEDAASLSITIMQKKLRGRTFLGCDSHPLSRQEIMAYVNQSGKFDKKFVGFTASDGPLGKKLHNSKTRAELEWEPKFTSFPQFLGLTY